MKKILIMILLMLTISCTIEEETAETALIQENCNCGKITQVNYRDDGTAVFYIKMNCTGAVITKHLGAHALELEGSFCDIIKK